MEKRFVDLDAGAAESDTPVDLAHQTDRIIPIGSDAPKVFGEHFARVAGFPKTGARKRLLFLGGCLSDSLIVDLRTDFDCQMLWRRPTIAMMSAPIVPAGALGKDNRQTRYVLRDCEKAHLTEAREASYDAFVFEIIRDARVKLLRCGDTYLLHPNEMHGLVPDAPPPHEAQIDLADFLGPADLETLDCASETFLETWKIHFQAFYDRVLKPAIEDGRLVIMPKAYLTKQTTPESEDLRSEYAHIESVNAALERMYAFVDGFAGIRQIGVDHAFCQTGRDARWGGIGATHFTTDIFALMADQIRSLIDPRDPRIGHALFSNLRDYVVRMNALRTQYDLEVHALKRENFALRQKLDFETALHAWEARRRENRRLSNQIAQLAGTVWRALRPRRRRAPAVAPQATTPASV